jgi:NitT/TauT family transport system ATP-binding protein
MASPETIALDHFVDLRGVSLTYGEGDSETLALEKADLSIAKGEFAAVVGPSGCGKSTLMRLVSGLMPPTTGAVFVAGDRVTRPLSCVGMAFQNPTLLPWRTTLANVMLPLEIVQPHCRTFRRDRQKYVRMAEDLLASVGLSGFSSRFPWQLSGGMQMRASLCRALIHAPELLMLDEPFAALDAFTREELWSVLQSVWMEKRFTVIHVTHDLREAVFLSDTVYVISKRPGRVVGRTTIELKRPRTLDDTYGHEFNEYVHALRRRIGEVRAQ